RHCVTVRGGFEAAEGGLEFAGVDDEGRAELVGGLAQLAEQGREDARDREQCRAGDAGVDRYRLAGGFGDHVEELPGGQRLGRLEITDLPPGFLSLREN